jgi:hypothetical protein
VKQFTIVAVDKAMSRLELAKKLGATIAAGYTNDFVSRTSAEAIAC